MKQDPPAIYFIQEHLHRQPRHGGIGNTDMEKVLLREGYQPIQFPGLYSSSLLTKIQRLAHLARIILSLPRKAVVIYQHPLYAGIHRALVKWLGKLRGITFICIILDIDGVRDENSLLLRKELSLFREMDYLVVHNDTMAGWLSAQKVNRPYACLEFFDFLAPPIAVSRSLSPVVVYAGNLDRAGFVKKLGEVAAVRFHIYGEPTPGQHDYSPNTIYKGAFEPYELAEHLEGSFGLVWNGDETDQLKGPYHEYIKLISPHKLSQYLLAGLPVIVHEEAAAAKLVRQLNIGFTIRSLSEIPEKIAALSEQEYAGYCRHGSEVARRIRGGEGVTTAVKSILSRHFV